MAASSKDHPTFAQLSQTLFQAALENIVHDITITAHKAHRDLLDSLNPQTRLPHCEQCNLPRVLDPPLAPKVRGATAEPPRDMQYCERRPWARRAGHDIYDNPFLKSDVTGRAPTKKEREAAKNAKKEKDEGTPASEEGNKDGTNPPSPSQNGGDEDKGPQKLEKGEKKASKIDEKLKKGEYVPWHTCPSCKRSLLITRFAKHLELCMGLSGRAASRNAMAKMNGSTPTGSRAGTPGPGGSQESKTEGGKDGEDEDEDLAVKGPGLKKKLLKRSMKDKIKKSGEKMLANGKLPKGLAAKRPPGSNTRASPAPSSTAGDKRERDDGDEDDGDEIQMKKRQKLQRVGSTASIGSQSTGLVASADMERGESQDGSFVDDGASVADD